MKILIIGGGNMGKTYADSFIAQHIVETNDLYLLERLPERVDFLKAEGYAHVFYQPGEYFQAVDLIVLAVKPQDRFSLFEQISAYFKPDQLVLSIMAGVTIQGLKDILPTTKIVRAMPNLPAQIGMGMTGFTADNSVSKEDLFMIQNLLNTTGKSLFFEDEKLIDAVTAISGSGPAYVFYFMEAMMQTARELGFSENQAEVLVEQTFMGAIHLFNFHNFSCQEWIGKVASRGGTTEAALQVFGEHQLNELIGKGLHRANARAIELGS
ncbi:MAG: pyrroline-5-carboxylate reductase [Microscillaceae bacterium]|jgi:pyrroline-5-carboxylate reductase|nr:pyrroline-5-carboxylate reductase [Microscillaceae bacterium]